MQKSQKKIKNNKNQENKEREKFSLLIEFKHLSHIRATTV